MYFFVAGAVTQPDQLAPHMEAEARALDELRRDGVMREAFRKASGHGVIGIVEAASLEEAMAQLDRLPFVALGLMTFEYTEIVEL
jgi:uncharacterized protein YciI